MLQIYERDDLEELKRDFFATIIDPDTKQRVRVGLLDRFCGNSEVRSVDLSLAPPPPPEEIEWTRNTQFEGEPVSAYSVWTRRDGSNPKTAPKVPPKWEEPPSATVPSTNQRAKAERRLKGTVRTHSHASYKNYGCRCDVCITSMLAWQRNNYLAKKAKRPTCTCSGKWQSHGRREICSDCGRSRKKSAA